jgi:coenzyme F420 hydrogenase subunit beta
MIDIHHNTFKDMMNDVVAAGTCCECGACVLVCPHNVIEYIDNKPKQTAKESAEFDHCGISTGVGCDVCASVCPRLWPREEHLRNATFKDQRPYEDIFGVYRNIFVARTKNDKIMERAQDGGIVTALQSWAFRNGHIDGSIVSAVGPDDPPCFPSPQCATSVEEIESSSSSWYTYCANNLALEEAKQKDLKKVSFVGVPCQITPLRKMQYVDPAFLVTARKKAKPITRQRDFLRGYSDRVSFSIGLFCTEVFRPELMTERIEKEMGIPLTEVSKFNVKGKVLIYKKDGTVETIPLKEAMEEYQRPECKHCGDFSAELADISCGGVGTDRATIVVLRTEKGEKIWRDFEASGEVEVEPIEANPLAWKVLLRLSRRQRNRVPESAQRSGTTKDLPQYSAKIDADHSFAALLAQGKTTEEIADSISAAYGEEFAPEEEIHYMAGQPISDDPGDPAPGEKRIFPPAPSPAKGGASPD